MRIFGVRRVVVDPPLDERVRVRGVSEAGGGEQVAQVVAGPHSLSTHTGTQVV